MSPVTLIVRILNHEIYIDQCLDSILNQSAFDLLKIVIIDNASTGGQLGSLNPQNSKVLVGSFNTHSPDSRMITVSHFKKVVMADMCPRDRAMAKST